MISLVTEPWKPSVVLNMKAAAGSCASSTVTGSTTTSSNRLPAMRATAASSCKWSLKDLAALPAIVSKVFWTKASLATESVKTMHFKLHHKLAGLCAGLLLSTGLQAQMVELDRVAAIVDNDVVMQS